MKFFKKINYESVDFDKNKLFDIYSASFNNQESKLITYMKRNGIHEINEIVKDFSKIQNESFEYLWELTKPDIQLTSEEIKKLITVYCNNKYSWMNEIGIKALLRWIYWMGWHEGLIKKAENN